jgi:predicted RNase H-like nuclease (RuvC/YqgF family)
MAKVVQAILNRESPIFLLRHLQRERLGTRRRLLKMREELEKGGQGGREQIRLAQQNAEALRREIVQLERMRNRVANFDGLRTNLIDDKIKSLREELAQYEAFLKQGEQRQKAWMERQREIVRISKSLEDLDRKIALLNQAIAHEGTQIFEQDVA